MDWQTIGAATGAVLGVCGIVGLLYRFVLLPNLRSELVVPVAETHRQVTGPESSSASDPTLREQVDDLHDQVRDTATKLAAMGRMFDGHLDWAQDEVDALWAELRAERAQEQRQQEGKHRNDTNTE